MTEDLAKLLAETLRSEGWNAYDYPSRAFKTHVVYVYHVEATWEQTGYAGAFLGEHWEDLVGDDDEAWSQFPLGSMSHNIRDGWMEVLR